MWLRETWMLGLGIFWLCAPAQAAPFRAGPVGNEDHHGSSSLHSKEARLSKHPTSEHSTDPNLALNGGSFGGIWQGSVGSLPPGLEKKNDSWPPGLENKGDSWPPGLEKNDSWPPGLVNKGDSWPPGLAENDDSFPPADLPGGAALIPEPTGLVLFGGGLLLARAWVRRPRSW